jgi:hypothetical protein
LLIKNKQKISSAKIMIGGSLSSVGGAPDHKGPGGLASTPTVVMRQLAQFDVPSGFKLRRKKFLFLLILGINYFPS